MDEVVKSGRVRKRAPNACTRCRKQKIKCSGNVPCEQCSRRNVNCAFDDKQHKILVSQTYIAELERRAAGQSPHNGNQIPPLHHIGLDNDPGSPGEHGEPSGHGNIHHGPGSDDIEDDHASPSEPSTQGQTAVRTTPEANLTNPLDPNNSDSFTLDTASRRFFLGVSSNWSFGRRVLRMVHEKVNDTPLPAEGLQFEGSTYDLGWDGHRRTVAVDTSSLPTSDFAVFLINAVKFHCGRLFHLFDETLFMHYFTRFYEDPGNEANYPRLWFIHFLLILAFGKAFIVGANKSKRPPGAELFVQGMQLLPDITGLYTDPVQSTEVLCCAALYLQCLDLRSAAYNVIGQAFRLAVEQGLHTDMQSLHLPDAMVERCREVWWTVYILDRHMTSLMGVPMSLSDDEITACLPTFAGQTKKAIALSLHVRLAKAEAVILQTVYGRGGGRSERFLLNMKGALRTIASANEQRNASFPLDLDNTSILSHTGNKTVTLFFPTEATGVDKAIASVCVARRQIARQESFIPFDRDAAFSSAVVLNVAATVDPSLVKNKDPRLQTALAILDEMTTRGNRIAEFHKFELEQLAANLRRLQAMSSAANEGRADSTSQVSPNETTSLSVAPMDGQNSEDFQTTFDNIDTILSEWNSDDGLSGEHLMAVADSLDFGQLNWLTMGDFEQPMSVGH
ncbi:Proline utilization trans-activator [Fulvia fulva]|uniref:Proline utilization trans-activator n=1 Tax=Passalora fulva TaxID=5499 RepID=A0A9Q8UTL8_PASFU|nr:Proline utilization trans-activator [Fulvia fulva]KAK4613741.1 Proline utilization trans-activator [Fulvia fulva]UJO21953.1 Proline utilization trans-activator [Fulvia fulva]WPV20531.1 Proline utilization trans-activator [Fulvia fulva]WPV35101.1 Proline utilization trans-activator [Fulvia fulva]